jgi:hypothetical protein
LEQVLNEVSHRSSTIISKRDQAVEQLDSKKEELDTLNKEVEEAKGELSHAILWTREA